MFNLHINLLMAFDLIRNIVAAEPDRMGQSENGACMYATENNGVLTPVCIIGQMFANLGILRVLVGPRGFSGTYNSIVVNKDDRFDSDALCNAGGLGKVLRGALEKNYNITFSDDAFGFLSDLQFKQDGGYTWSEAFENASAYLFATNTLTPPEPASYAEQAYRALENYTEPEPLADWE